MNISQIEWDFSYHAPKTGQSERYMEIRDEAKRFAHLIYTNCPESRERNIAFEKLEECVMWAITSIDKV